jgi:MFS family permease
MFDKIKNKLSHKLDFIFLDSLNVFIAPLGGGAGAYIAYYFASSRHWHSNQIGLLLSIMAVSLALAQIPAGLLIDRVAKKNYVTAAALGVIALCWLCMLAFPSEPVVFISQALVGASCAFFGPAIASITLQLVGHDGLGKRLGRSGVFSHFGNMLTAISIGVFTAYLSGQTIIGLLIFFAVLSALSALGIKTTKTIPLNSSATIEQDTYKKRFYPLFKGILGLISTPGSRAFTIAALLYTFANASMLPLMVQLISKQGAHAASVQLPSALLITEFVMIPVCFLASRMLHLGRRPLLIVSYVFLVLRGIGFTVIHVPAAMVAMQVLDGISAGIFSLVLTVVIADFCRHNDRFSSTLAATYMVMTLANGLSEFSSGMLASYLGFNSTFAILTVVAFVGLVIVVTLLPETRDLENPVLVNNNNALPANS